MATRANQLITVRRGETAALVFPVKDAAGAAINLTGYTFKFRIAASRLATVYLVNITSGGQLSLVSVDGTDDGIQVALTGTDTLQTKGRYFWDLRVTSGSGNVKVVAEGHFVVEDSVTDD